MAHLESGEFEGIVSDTVLRRQLDRFISEHSSSYDSNVLVLLMPTQEINRSPSLLTGLMSKYYAGSDAQRVSITPMGAIAQSQTSVILIRSNEGYTHTFKEQEQHSAVIPDDIDADSISSGNPAFLSSFNDEIRSSCSEDDPQSPISRASLSRVPTIESPIEPIIRVQTQFSSSQHSFQVGDSETVSMMTEDTGYSLQPFPTRVSAMSAVNHKLVLRSMLLKDLQTGEMKTAIRQIEDSSMCDEWLLYDETFTMTNLQLCSLQEIIESNALCCKFLFYALVADTPSLYDDEDTDEEIGEHDLTVVEFDGGVDDYSQPIRFIMSNTTQATTPINLSKTNTLHTNHESIRSEMMIHRPDSLYPPVLRSKSTPATGIKKIKKKKSRSRVNNEKCLIM